MKKNVILECVCIRTASGHWI